MRLYTSRYSSLGGGSYPTERNDISGLWRRHEERLDERLRFHVRNVALLRVSVEDAAANRKLRGLNEDFEDTIDTQATREPGFDDVDYTDEDGAKERQACWDAFVDVLSTAGWGSSIKDLPVGAALQSLGEEADAADAVGTNDLGVGGVAESHRGRWFYTELQDIQESPLRGFGLLGREEVAGIEKRQRKEDADVVARIRGASDEDASAAPDQGRASVLAPRQKHESVEMEPQMRVELGQTATHTDVALTLTRTWTLNKQQALALMLPAAFLDDRGARLQEEEGPQHFQYVGGEGGTGKPRVIHAIQGLFRLKEAEHALLLTGASGNAAALIGGVTLHSATGIGFEGNSEAGRRVSEEEKLRWKSKVMLVVDEISQVGGLTLASVDNRMQQYRDDARRPFGGIPIVVLFGDFYQFDPVQQTSLLLPRPRGYSDRSNPESVAKHLAAHKLFLQFRSVVMLKEQVRASGCARLRGFLGRLRRGEQTELDFERLRQRVYDKPTQPTFADGLRAITPLNQDRWNLNMAAVVQHTRARGQHVSVFAARHHTEPGLFFYVKGIPVVVTRNLHVGLKLARPSPSFCSRTRSPPWLYRVCPRGAMLLPSKTVAIPEAMRGKGGPRSRSKPGFRWVTHRTGPLCTPAFAMTDQKSQGKQYANVLLNLKGSKPGTGQGEGARPSFMSLYVQLSRATQWEGLYLFREPARSDFIEPKNVLDSDMREAVARPERQASETRARSRWEHGQRSWYAAWDATEEGATAAGEDAGEDTTLCLSARFSPAACGGTVVTTGGSSARLDTARRRPVDDLVGRPVLPLVGLATVGDAATAAAPSASGGGAAHPDESDEAAESGAIPSHDPNGLQQIYYPRPALAEGRMPSAVGEGESGSRVSQPKKKDDTARQTPQERSAPWKKYSAGSTV
ncbi:uncharacterized protein PG998_014543 [Apiospora kogelbergensis]|uniref:uncharacterized protein n=1 Tax=Apiospora kogelbergensis TaxID=1337665 RepID=UPI003131058A